MVRIHSVNDLAETRHSLDPKTSSEILEILCRYYCACLQAQPSVLSPLSKTRSKESAASLQNASSGSTDFATIGFNETTEHLEAEIRNETKQHLRAVFVARGDTSSSQLYAHLPMMAAMLPNLRLVSFARGAEARLCQALSKARIGVIGLMVSRSL